MARWGGFFLGELGAAAALAGLLFVSVSVNQTRILQLGRIVNRGLEALAMLFLVVVVASAALVPGQPLRLLGGEIALAGLAAFVVLVRLQHSYLGDLDPLHRPKTMGVVLLNRFAVGLIVLAGGVLVARGDTSGFYLLAPAVLLSFGAAGANAWVLLVEINR